MTGFSLSSSRPSLIRLTPGNAAWSWWTWPRATQLDQSVFIGSVGTGINVDEYDLQTHTSHRWQLSDLGGDDHSNPAILTQSGKVAIAAYSQHSKDPYVRIRRGLQPIEGGFGPLAPEQLIEAPLDRVTYAVAHTVGETIHLWFRCHAVYWAHTRSDDWGLTWSTPSLIFKGDNQLYCAFHQIDSDRALVALTTHPYRNGTQSIHAAEVNYGQVTSNCPTDLTRLNLIAEPPKDHRTWVYDVSDIGVLWSSFSPDDMASTGVYHLTDWTNTTSHIASTGQPFLDDGRNFYAGGAQFHYDGILISRHTGGEWTLEHHAPSHTSTLISESDGCGIPVRAWPVWGGKGAAVNMLRRFDMFNDFDSYIAGIEL